MGKRYLLSIFKADSGISANCEAARPTWRTIARQASTLDAPVSTAAALLGATMDQRLAHEMGMGHHDQCHEAKKNKYAAAAAPPP